MPRKAADDTTPESTSKKQAAALGARDEDFGLPQVTVQPLPQSQPSTARPSAARVPWFAFLVLGVALGSGLGYLHFRLQRKSHAHASLTPPSVPAAAVAPHPHAATVKAQPDTLPPQESADDAYCVAVPTGHCYIIASSFRNEANARRYVRLLREKGMESYLLLPDAERSLYRVAIARTASRVEAQKAMRKLQPQYQATLWIFQY